MATRATIPSPKGLPVVGHLHQIARGGSIGHLHMPQVANLLMRSYSTISSSRCG